MKISNIITMVEVVDSKVNHKKEIDTPKKQYATDFRSRGLKIL